MSKLKSTGKIMVAATALIGTATWAQDAAPQTAPAPVPVETVLTQPPPLVAHNAAEEAALYPYAQFGVTVRPEDMPNGDYGGLYTWPEMVTEMNGWLRDYPSIISVQSLGRTVENRPIPLFKISDNPKVDEDEPEILYLVGVHPRENPPTFAILSFVKELLEGYGKNAELTELINTHEIWVVPMLNIDGKIYDMQSGNGTDKGVFWRKNRRLNSDGTVGVDLNRNFLSRWGGARQVRSNWKTDTLETDGYIYEGPAPASEPETRAAMDFIARRPLRVMLDLHAPLNDIRTPGILSETQYPIYQRLLKQMQSTQKRAYKLRVTTPGDAPTDEDRDNGSGVSYPWSYFATGAYSFNIEIGSEKGPNRHYVSPEFGLREYRENIRGPLLTLLCESGNLPLAKPGTNTFGKSQWEGTPKAGERVVWKPQIEGDFEYAWVSSDSAAGVVKLEYRNAPATEGFPIQLQPDAQKGARIPLTVHVWTRDRGHSVLKEDLVVE